MTRSAGSTTESRSLPARGRPPAFLIIGGSFNNKGSEAMIQTVADQLGRRWPSASLTVSSYSGKADARLDAGEDPGARFEYIRHSRSWSLPARVFVLGLPSFRAVKARLTRSDPYLRALSAADVVVDISGFALSDQRPLVRRFVYGFEIWSSRWVGARFVALTQAFGPFTGVTRLLAKASLPLADLVVARGDESARNLRDAGIREFVQCADMAYLFRGDTRETGLRVLRDHGVPDGVPTFGIVPNINLYRHASGDGPRNAYLTGLARLAALAIELGAHPVFLCHEGYAGRRDDEWLARQAIELSGGGPWALVPASHTAAALKGAIAALDFVVACRFHSIVAAISTATPFMALGWSHKYGELVAEAGEASACVDGRRSDPSEWRQRAADLWAQRDGMRDRLGQVAPRLQASAETAFERLAERLSDWPSLQQQVTPS